MSADTLFSICSTIALFSWIVLIFFTFWKSRDRYLFSTVILLFCILYVWLIFSNIKPAGLNDFENLDGITRFFSNKTLLLAGWVHYLAFDLLTGIYIVRDARQKSINHWILLPALIFTFLLGPAGLLIYFFICVFRTKQFFNN